jgi:hypothetical protein
MADFFFELVSKTDEGRRGFETNPVVLDAVANGMQLERYQRFLLELYHVVWHFNPICAAAASRINDVHGNVRYYLYEHMHEESGHERWVLDDLASVGVDNALALRSPPRTFTQALVGFTYWCADRQDPCSILGMVYALEVIASVYGGPFSAAMRESLLLEADKGDTFISSHASLDTDHMVRLRSVLNTIEGHQTRDSICQSTLVNFHHCTRIFEGL